MPRWRSHSTRWCATVWRVSWPLGDRVGMAGLIIVAAFLVLIALSARAWWRRLAAGDRRAQRAAHVAGPEPAEASARSRCRGAERRPVRRSTRWRPSYKEWDERAAQFKIVETKSVQTLPLGATGSAATCCPRRSRARDLGLRRRAGGGAGHHDRHAARRGAGFFGGRVNDFLEWLYNVFTSIPEILLIFAFAAVFGRGIGTVALILGITGWTGVYRQVRAEFIKHRRASTCAPPRRSAPAPARACSATSCPT